MLARQLILIVAVVVMTICVVAAVVLYFRRLFAERPPQAEGRRCVCGYLLIGLQIPQCPECGRMIGFNKTPEELGVTQEQMRAEAERRRATRGRAEIP